MATKKSARRTRRTHTPAFKAQVALAALREDKTIAELAKQFRSAPQPDHRMASPASAECLGRIRRQLAGDAAGGPPTTARQDRPADAGERFFRTRAHQGGIAQRKAMFDRSHNLSITRQAELLGISRGSVYNLPRAVSDADLALMRRLDELHLEHPFMGARILGDQLRRQGIQVARRHVTTLMQRMGIEALCPQPGSSKPAPGHKVYPYLLRKLSVTRSNQVWALDTTYIAMARGFVYLTAVVDVASREVMAHKVAITLQAGHAREVLEQAFARYGVPQIVNTDQGSQFTAIEFTQAVLGRGCRLSMDGRGAWRDNVFVKRLWRSVKHERVYLKAYDSVSAARADIADYLAWYNEHRAHSSLERLTPHEAYLAGLLQVKLAA